VQKHDDEPKSTVPDCHNLFFVRLAESIGRLAGEWIANDLRKKERSKAINENDLNSDRSTSVRHRGVATDGEQSG
jgi:hypothetical protein